jgi:branched-chain amino acid transport system permease protein
VRQRLHITLLAAASALSGALLLAHPRQTLLLLPLLGTLMLCMTLRIPRWIRMLAAGALLLIVVPFAGFHNSFLFELGIQIGIFSALALGLNVVVGLAGLLDLGYAAFFALGAYTWAIFGSDQANQFIAGGHFPLAGWPWFYVFIVLATVVAAATGTIVGLPALRLRGDYLAVVTLGLGQVVRTMANNLDHPVNFTNGPQGISPVARPPIGWLTAVLDAAGFHLREADSYALFFYLLVLAVMGVVVLVNVRLDRSRFGRAWVAMREDEIAARAVGISLVRAKLLAFATGAAFSGGMGAIFSAKQLFVSPESFTLLQSITILAMVILGGMGSIRGAIVGATAVTLLNIEVLKSLSDFLNGLRQSGFELNLLFFKYNLADLPSQLEPAKYERMIFGLILVLMMIFRPQGLLPERRHREELQDEEGADAKGLS